MKQKDLILVSIIAFISGVISIVASNMLITAPKNRQQKVEVVTSITADFPKPDSKYFNTNSIDPTRLITIGTNVNLLPFNDKTQ